MNEQVYAQNFESLFFFVKQNKLNDIISTEI